MQNNMNVILFWESMTVYISYIPYNQKGIIILYSDQTLLSPNILPKKLSALATQGFDAVISTTRQSYDETASAIYVTAFKMELHLVDEPSIELLYIDSVTEKQYDELIERITYTPE